MGGGGVSQKRTQLIRLCSNNDVILRTRGRGVKKSDFHAYVLTERSKKASKEQGHFLPVESRSLFVSFEGENFY